MKKALTLIVFLSFLLTCSTMFAQVTAELHGVSPRQAHEDSTDIYDVAFNANANAGVETIMYLKGSDPAGTWNIIEQPVGSAAVIGATEAGDDYLVAVFVPDVAGTYKIEFTDGSAADTLTINAALYLGMDGGAISCTQCHSGQAAMWAETGHSDILTKGLDGILSSHYSESCIICHSTGYDVNANNDGFDDFDFVFPDSLYMGVYDMTVAAYPEAMARGNIQCEACHGPGSAHMGMAADNKMTSSLDEQNCALCHDEGPRHYFPAQWRYSGHDATDFDGRGFHGGHSIGAFAGYAGGRAGCAACHSGSGYVQWDKEGKPVNSDGLPSNISTVPDATTFTCAVCHDPHDASEVHQLRLSDTNLGDGTPVTVELYGTGAQCMECHRSRRNAAEYTSDPGNASSHYGPHHGPQADMLIGANYPDYGIEFPTSPHAVSGSACVDCHMSNENPVDEEGNVNPVGGHSFNMNDSDGNDHVEACAPCHGNVGETFKEKKYFLNGVADHDGDGVAEGIQEEVHGMMEELHEYLPQDSLGNVDMSQDGMSVTTLRGGYVYMWVEEDRSFGIHNPAFTVALLKAAIESFKYGAIEAGQIVSVSDIPMDQGNQVRVVWTAFGADDGVARDQVKEYVLLRHAENMMPKSVPTYGSISELPASLGAGDNFIMDGHLWDAVAVVPATQFIEYSVVAPTLYNTVEADTAWATFKVLGKTEGGIIAETEPMAGWSTDDLAPIMPTGLAARLDGSSVELNWDAPYDTDVETFDVYRSVDADFDINTAEYLGSTRNLTFTDASLTGSTIYYSITAVDFSKNVSDNAPPVSVVITDVADEMGIPSDFELYANYPNPFNPSTQIKFGLPANSEVKLTIYNAVGKEVATLVNEQLSAGYHVYTWNAANNASGVYFYQIQTDNIVQVKKMVLVK